MVKENIDALKLVRGLKKPERNMVLINPLVPLKEVTNLNNFFEK
jgi:hypothetical protein